MYFWSTEYNRIGLGQEQALSEYFVRRSTVLVPFQSTIHYEVSMYEVNHSKGNRTLNNWRMLGLGLMASPSMAWHFPPGE